MKLEPTSVTDDYQWIFPLDDAIPNPDPPGEGAKKTEILAYVEARKAIEEEIEAALTDGDLDRVPKKPGMTPAVWTLQHLRGKAARWARRRIQRAIGDHNTEIEVGYVLVAHALIEVEGVWVGKRELVLRREYDPRLGFETVTEDIMDQLCQVPGLIEAMTETIANTFLRPKKKHSTG